MKIKDTDGKEMVVNIGERASRTSNADLIGQGQAQPGVPFV
jgi:hypothetical protein